MSTGFRSGGSSPKPTWASIRKTALAAPHVSLNPPGTIDLPRRPASNQPLHVAPQYKAAALLRRGNPITPPNTPLNFVQQKALQAIHAGHVAPNDSVTQRLLLNPGPQLQHAIDSTPGLTTKHQAVKTQIQKTIGVPATPKPAPAPPSVAVTAYTGAPKSLQNLAAAHAAQYEGKIIPPATMQKLQEAAALDFAKMPSNIVDRFAQGALNSVFGLPQALWTAGKAANADMLAMNQGHAPTQTYDKVIHPMAQQIGHRWSPLVHGNFGEFAHQLSQDPWAYTTDAAAGASAGLGAAGKIAGAEAGMASLDRAASVERVTAGKTTSTVVGGRYIIRRQRGNKFSVYDNQQKMGVGSGFASKEDAINHATLQGMPLSFQVKGMREEGADALKVPTRKEAAIAGFRNPGIFDKSGGHLFDYFGKKNGWSQSRIQAANQKAVDDLKQFAVDAAEHQPGRTSVLQGAKNLGTDAAEMFHSTLAYDQSLPLPKAIAYTTFRELSDLTKKATIYLKGSYLAPNLVGNLFMNGAHMGFFAPVEMTKSFVLWHHMDPVNLRTMREAMGQSSTETLNAGIRPSRDNPQGYGYVASALHPVSKIFTKITDQVPRDAAMLYELRQRGFSKIDDVNNLFNVARDGGPRSQEAWHVIVDSARTAQDEIGKFGHMNSRESWLASQIFYVYTWSKFALQYAAKFPLQHPVLTSGITNAGALGQAEQQKLTGGEGLSNSQRGKIIVGKKPNGDPILIDPVLGPSTLSSGIQGAKAIYGSAKALSGSKTFDPRTDTSLLDMASFPITEAVKAATGRHPNVERDIKNQVPPYRAYEQSQHPGLHGEVQRTSADPWYDFALGSGFHPKTISLNAMSDQHEKELANDPHKKFAFQMLEYKRLTGKDPHPKLVSSIQSEIDHKKIADKFKSDYADHQYGQGSYNQLTPRQKAETAVAFLERYHVVSDGHLNHYKNDLARFKDDAHLNHLANSLWARAVNTYALDHWAARFGKLKGKRSG